MNDKRLGQAELLGIQECCQRAATRGGALFAVVVHVEHKHGAVERELAARTAVAVSQTIYLKTTSLLRINHCTCYSSDRLHLTRRDRALRCCASAIASSDAVQRLSRQPSRRRANVGIATVAARQRKTGRIPPDRQQHTEVTVMMCL